MEYGDRLLGFESKEFMGGLIEQENKSHYQRFSPLIAVSQSLMENLNGNFYVVLYDY